MDPSTDLMRLHLTEPVPGVVVLAVDGEIDMTTQGAFLDAATRAIRSAARHVVVDLSAVTYMGSAGLSALADAHDQAREHGIGFCSAASSAVARRVLELSGLDVTSGHRDTVDEVLDQFR